MAQFSFIRFHQARDMCILLGMKLMGENCGDQINLLSDRENSHHPGLHLMREDLFNTVLTSQRFGAVNKSQKVDARCVKKRCFRCFKQVLFALYWEIHIMLW